MSQMSCGEAIAKMLKAEGVEKVFGIIDGTYFGFYSNLKKYGIELISPRHETTAAHMAGAYARSTGKLGVCMASNGPGVANILPGVAVENAEGNRVLLITSSRRHEIVYPDRGGSYQCFNQTAVIGAMSKYSVNVPTPTRLTEIMKQAFRRSYAGRPGVVHVDVPENFMNGKFKFNDSEFTLPETYRRTDPQWPGPKQVMQAAKMLSEARCPVIHAGSGIIHAKAHEQLAVLANKLQIPVTTSWGARGALDESNDLSMPMIYVGVNNELRKSADLILVLGSRMGETDWWGKMPNWGDENQKFIQVDIDDDFLARNRKTELVIQSDVKVFLSELNKVLEEKYSDRDYSNRRTWYENFLTKKEKKRADLDKHLSDDSTPMNTAHVANICKKVFNHDSIAVFDGGNTAIWGQFFYTCRSGNSLGTPKMGMLGAGQGQALGAQAAFPDKQVYCILGDGAMGFHMQEIETAVRNNMPVTFIVICDKQWGMVKMNQQFALKPLKTMIKKSLDEHETINADLGEIAFDKLAMAMGAHGERVSSAGELKAALERCVSKKQCSVVHVDVDPVKHMWAPSLIDFKKMHEEPAGK